MCRTCRECTAKIESVRAEALFCSIACKNRFNNRRLQRGAELYDLFMAVRYQRSLAKCLGLWSIVCGLAQRFREDDEEVRPGFVSWLDPGHVLARKPALRSKRLR